MKDKKYFIGIDQGTSGTKGCIIDENAEVVKSVLAEVSLIKISEKEIEQDIDEIYASVKSTLDELIDYADQNGMKVESIGFSFQRSGVCAWDKAGVKKHNLISWSDTRTSDKIEALKEQHSFIFDKTGMPASPHYAAAKIALLQKMFADEAVDVGTLDMYIHMRLSHRTQFFTEESMASRTMLYDLNERAWSDKLLEIFEVSKERLPDVKKSISTFYYYQGIPVNASLGDQQAALFASYVRGQNYILNLGSIASLAYSSEDCLIRKEGFISTVLFSEPKNCSYIIEATTNACGAVIAFMIDDLKVIKNPDEINSLSGDVGNGELSEQKVAFLPIKGTAAPEWLNDLPLVFNFDYKSDSKSTIRACLENIANFIVFNVKQFESCGQIDGRKTLIVSGGVARIDYLLQYISDCTGYDLQVLEESNASAEGAALASGYPLSFSKDHVISPRPGKKVAPQNPEAIKRFEKWCEIKERVIANNLEGLWKYE